jgi:hypothetical protein
VNPLILQGRGQRSTRVANDRGRIVGDPIPTGDQRGKYNMLIAAFERSPAPQTLVKRY